MLLDGLFNRTSIPLYNRSLDAATLRQRIRANNIANANTIGYKRLEVRFEEKLRQALKASDVEGTTTQPGHIPIGRQRKASIEPEVYQPNDPGDASGVNNVDIEREMALLAKNFVLYESVSKFTHGTFTHLLSAIRGRSA